MCYGNIASATIGYHGGKWAPFGVPLLNGNSRLYGNDVAVIDLLGYELLTAKASASTPPSDLEMKRDILEITPSCVKALVDEFVSVLQSILHLHSTNCLDHEFIGRAIEKLHEMEASLHCE